jgi:hypothetical protein
MDDKLRRDLEELQQLIKDLGIKISEAIERARELESRLHDQNASGSPEDSP